MLARARTHPGRRCAAVLLCCSLMAAGCATAFIDPDGGQHDTRGRDLGFDVPGQRDGQPDRGPFTLEAAVGDRGPRPDSRPWPDLRPPPDTGTTGKNCVNGKDDDADGKIDCIDLADCGNKKPCLDPTRSLVIYEVSCGDPSYVALRNASNVPRNIGGWKLQFTGISVKHFTLPVRSLAAGKLVHVFEFSKGASGDIKTGADIPFYAGTNSNSVVLRSPAGGVMDYAAFGSSMLALPSGATQVGGAVPYSGTGFDPRIDAHYRAGMKWAHPTYQRSDWLPYNKSR